jgi:hypothetical protein
MTLGNNILIRLKLFSGKASLLQYMRYIIYISPCSTGQGMSFSAEQALPHGNGTSQEGEIMVHVFVKLKVQDFSAWKKAFDGNAENRAKAGAQKWWVSHVIEDPNTVVIWLDWDSADRARAFYESRQMKDTFKMSGVTEEPEIVYLEEVVRGEPRAVPSR